MYFYQEFSQDRINSDFVVYAVTFISVVYAVTFISVVYAVTFISAQLTARTEAKTTKKQLNTIKQLLNSINDKCLDIKM